MKKLSRRDWAILIICAVCFLTIGFAVARIFQPEPVENLPPDVSKYLLTIDSLKTRNSELSTNTVLLKVRFDSLSNVKAINHEKLSHVISNTRTLTPIASKRYMDSIFAAETR